MKISILVQRIIMGIILIIILLIFFQPDIPFVMSLSENTMWIIFTLLFSSMIFLILRKVNLVYFTMFSAAILTLFLKDSSNENLMFYGKDINSSSLHIMHFNIIEVEETKNEFINKISISDPDIVSCQELSPSWNKFLISKLKNKYPYTISINQFDPDAKLVFSKYAFSNKDTFYLSGHPQLDVTIKFENTPINILFTYVLPYSMAGENAGNKYQLEDLSEYITNKDKTPLMIVGEFNQVYWAKKVRTFLYDTKLNNARRSVSFAVKNPLDHIFYSKHLRCQKLEEIFDDNSNHIGVEGFFKRSR